MATTAKPHAFAVEGVWAFPLDMLRYDACWPDTQADAAAMARTFEPGNRELVRVTLMCANPSAPTRERWNSFMWKVVS